MSQPRYLAAVKAGEGTDCPCVACGCPVVVLDRYGRSIAVDYDGHLHRERCQKLRQGYRKRQRARRRDGVR